MTSYTPAQCCIVGVKHEGEAKGEFKQIGDGISYTALFLLFPSAVLIVRPP